MGDLSSVENAYEGGRRQTTKRIGRKELPLIARLIILSMSPWTLVCILRGEVAWLCLSQHRHGCKATSPAHKTYLTRRRITGVLLVHRHAGSKSRQWTPLARRR